MSLASFLIAAMDIAILASVIGLIFSMLFRNSKGVVISIISVVFSAFGLTTANDFQERMELKELAAEEATIHQNLMSIPEGCYVLYDVIETDSAKTRFIIQLPGLAKRKVQMLAYEWNEWQAESAVPGDTLVIRDVWTNDSTGKKYDRTVQKLGPDDIGLGYVSTEWLERPGWQN